MIDWTPLTDPLARAVTAGIESACNALVPVLRKAALCGAAIGGAVTVLVLAVGVLLGKALS